MVAFVDEEGGARSRADLRGTADRSVHLLPGQDARGGSIPSLGSLRSDLALDAPEQAFYERQDEATDALVHHSERGVQYLSIRYTERLLRQYLPRKLGFSTLSQGELDLITAELNERPRETLDWKTSAEAFAEFVAMTGRAHAVEPTGLDPDTGERHGAASGGGRPHPMWCPEGELPTR